MLIPFEKLDPQSKIWIYQSGKKLIEAEKEVITIMVANDQMDRIFEKMYLAGQMDTPGMGFMYVTALEKAATYVPEEMIEKLVD